MTESENNGSVSLTQPKDKLIVMNLGCGNKLSPDTDNAHLVNVDIFPPKNVPENVTFVEDDVCKLTTFDNNYADQIHGYHLIEHINVWEVEKTLLRWFDVLKPGGCIILEQPDLIKACINVLQAHTTKEQQLVTRLGMYGLYGEPHIDQPYMCHKWGWTFETLSQVVGNVGFENILNLPAQTHMGPVRDFRLVAYKPISVSKD